MVVTAGRVTADRSTPEPEPATRSRAERSSRTMRSTTGTTAALYQAWRSAAVSFDICHDEPGAVPADLRPSVAAWAVWLPGVV